MGKRVSLNSLICPILLCISATTPWFESYRECFLQSMPASDHEFLNHYVACILWVLQTAPGKAVTKCNVGDTENFAVTLLQLWFEAYVFFSMSDYTAWFHKVIRVFFVVVWPELFVVFVLDFFPFLHALFLCQSELKANTCRWNSIILRHFLL